MEGQRADFEGSAPSAGLRCDHASVYVLAYVCIICVALFCGTTRGPARDGRRTVTLRGVQRADVFLNHRVHRCTPVDVRRAEV